MGMTRRSMMGGALGTAAVSGNAVRAAEGRAPSRVAHRWVAVDGVDVFYREAGREDAPVILLLHGFANSSFYFRHLMAMLGDCYRLIAPDMPSFGFTAVPVERRYDHTFAALTATITAFIDQLGLDRFAFYCFDYGAPVGFNIALQNPDRITGIISQSGNVYEVGLGEAAWAPLFAYWTSPSQDSRDAIRSRMTLDGVKAAYFQGVTDPSSIEPESFTLDAALLARPGNAELQVDLKLDYKSNIEAYPKYQAFLRTSKPPLVAVWGRNDPFFRPPGAEAFKCDVPDADVRLIDAGHFALETNLDEVARALVSMRLKI